MREWAYLAHYGRVSWAEFLELPRSLRIEMGAALSDVVNRENVLSEE